MYYVWTQIIGRDEFLAMGLARRCREAGASVGIE
jgi:hypothetical protein